MTIRSIRGVLATVVAVSAVAFVVQALAEDSAARPKPKGETWETTSQMSMEGMPIQMPVSRMKLCLKKDQQSAPSSGPPGGGACSNSNMKRDGNKVTWDIKCTNPDMTGVGEITYKDRSSYTGAIRFTSADGNMTIKLGGQKLPGECDNPQ